MKALNVFLLVEEAEEVEEVEEVEEIEIRSQFELPNSSIACSIISASVALH